ncbi:hypothetical protein Bca4012_026575 [Brassica carinata]
MSPSRACERGANSVHFLSVLLVPKKVTSGSQTLGLGGLNTYLRSVHHRLGPIITLCITSRPAIFVADRSLAHQALVSNGAVFADRPPAAPISKIVSSNQHNISSGSYGATWRLLRRNLTSDPSRHGSEEPIVVVDHLHYAMFALLVLMCFGDKLDEKQIKEVEFVQRRQLLSFSRFNILNLWPKLTKLIFRSRWEEFHQMRREQQDVLLPLIRARRKIVEERMKRSEDYVKNPEIQGRLYEEIKSVVAGEEAKEIEEEEAHKMPYLKAVVLEGLRRHPPGRFVLPHSVTEDTVLGGYKVPKRGTVNFMVAEIGRDPAVWDEPMAFKPERFMGEEEPVDITGNRGIKMMPFGAGRRICPGIGLAMLHLEYYLANMVKSLSGRKSKVVGPDLNDQQLVQTLMNKNLI